MAAPAKEETRRDSSYRTNDRNSDKGEVGWFKSTQAAHSTSYWWHPGKSEPTQPKNLLQQLRSHSQRHELPGISYRFASGRGNHGAAHQQGTWRTLSYLCLNALRKLKPEDLKAAAVRCLFLSQLFRSVALNWVPGEKTADGPQP